MGRKIPGKKQRKIKDPDKQRRQRFSEIKNKINNPPKKDDQQEMPKSVLRIMELKERAKAMDLRKKNRRKIKKDKEEGVVKMERFNMKRALGRDDKMPGMERPDRYFPTLEQGPSEHVERFAQRVNNACKELIKEVRFERKFKVEIKRNEDGNVTEVKQLKSAKRSKKPKLAEKRKSREASKLDGIEPEKEFAGRERFEFGDIVHAPPTNLAVPGKKSKTVQNNSKPGNLLLKTVLSPSNEVASAKKKLTSIEKQKQEQRRIQVVEAFRKLKNKSAS